MRILLKRGFFLVCLLTPLVAHGQKWEFMPGASTYIMFYDTRVATLALAKVSLAELGILNRDCKLGYHRVAFSSYSFTNAVVLDYGVGMARSRRFYFVSFSVGPSVFIDTKGVSPGVQGQIRALVMPLRFLGLGVSVGYSMPLFLEDDDFPVKEVGIGLTFAGRIS